MSITKILTEDTLDPSDKLERVAQVVAGARLAYGNSDEVIEAPYINTTHGSMSFVHLEDASKVEHLRGAIQQIKVEAIEFANRTPGSNLNKKIEELLATHGMFVNIDAGTKFEYI